jgi:ATP-citrate lyase beta-subunit
MGKVLEGHTMQLMEKWDISTPRFVIADSLEEFDALVEKNDWLENTRLVVKAHEAIGGRGLLGLVKMGTDLTRTRKAVEDIFAFDKNGITINQVIVQENVLHSNKREFYASIMSRRDGVDMLLSRWGGVNIENRWDSVQSLFIPIDSTPNKEILEGFAVSAGFDLDLLNPIADFLVKLLTMFNEEDATFLEINPFTVVKGWGDAVALDAVLELDEASRFRHPDWNFQFVSDLGRPMSHAEKKIQEIDEQVKGSVKFVELDGDTALLPAGGGASVFLADAVVRAGGTLANYAEYSGDPPDWAVEALTERVCSLKGIKRVIIGGAIANFTDVKKTFTGIIQGLRNVKKQGTMPENVEIWVRRGGPNEEEALNEIRKIVKEGFKIRVFDRKTALTDIVDMAFSEEAK